MGEILDRLLLVLAVKKCRGKSIPIECGLAERAVSDISGAWYVQEPPEIKLVLSL
jgi:hypothetical protein